MRSSKSRSRSKQNRNRPSTGGNVVNRVFDSSGPEGKVRGTPQQIIDKYNQLARDAQLGNDRVAAENFQQHAEHYLRLLSEAQREMDARRDEQEARREEHERQNRERQAERDRDRGDRGERDQVAPVVAPVVTPVVTPVVADPAEAPQPDVVELTPPQASEDSGLVDTPENAPKKPRRARTRKPAASKAKAKASADAPAAAPAEKPAEAADPEDVSKAAE